MSRLKFAVAIAGLIAIPAAAALAQAPNNAIGQARAKIRGYRTNDAFFDTNMRPAAPTYYAPAPVVANNGSTYRSFSYDPGVAPAPGYYYAPAYDTMSRASAPPKFYDANRKITGKTRYGY